MATRNASPRRGVSVTLVVVSFVIAAFVPMMLIVDGPALLCAAAAMMVVCGAGFVDRTSPSVPASFLIIAVVLVLSFVIAWLVA